MWWAALPDLCHVVPARDPAHTRTYLPRVTVEGGTVTEGGCYNATRNDSPVAWESASYGEILYGRRLVSTIPSMGSSARAGTGRVGGKYKSPVQYRQNLTREISAVPNAAYVHSPSHVRFGAGDSCARCARRVPTSRSGLLRARARRHSQRDVASCQVWRRNVLANSERVALISYGSARQTGQCGDGTGHRFKGHAQIEEIVMGADDDYFRAAPCWMLPCWGPFQWFSSP